MTTSDVRRGPSFVPFQGRGGLPGARSLRPRGKVLPEYARSHNRALVLQTLYRTANLSRADISRETGLTRVTVSDLIAELIAEGLVIEVGLREGSRPGKPAVLLEIDSSAFQIVGLDLSEHDRFRGAVLDLKGQVITRAEVLLETSTGDAALTKVTTLLDTLLEGTTAPLLGVGVGSPGIVDLAGGVLRAPNLGWSDLALQETLAEHCGLPLLVANDANVAALAEHGFGNVLGDFALIKVGHGVGAGLVLDGTPLFGSRFAAGEIGHVVVGEGEGRACACGKAGCLETWLAIPRLEAALAAAGDDDSARTAVLRNAGRHLGMALAPVVGALNLSEIVLSGPEGLLGGELLDSTLATLRERTMTEFHSDLTLRMTQQGSDIVLRGAAVLVLSSQLGVS